MATPAPDLARQSGAASGALDGRPMRARLRRIRELLTWLAELGPVDPPRLFDEPATALAVERILTLLVDLALACNTDVAAAAPGRAPQPYEGSVELARPAGMML